MKRSSSSLWSIALKEINRHCPFISRICNLSVFDAISDSTLRAASQSCPVISRKKEPTCLHITEDDKVLRKISFTKIPYTSRVCEILNNIQKEGRYRVFHYLRKNTSTYPIVSCRTGGNKEERVVVWCSNDYLGMSNNRQVIEATKKAIDEFGCGAGGTRNIAGSACIHLGLEATLADWHGYPNALLFSSGYVANSATLSSLGRMFPDALMISDSDNHASMIEGISLSKCEKIVFAHNDMNQLESILKKQPLERPKVIAFESIYSMDGSLAPLNDIEYLATKYNCLTFVDEVHAVGMYGLNGSGFTKPGQFDIVSGTLGKAVGVFGGYIASSNEIIDSVRSCAKGFIFTTALPPSVVAAAKSSIEHIKRTSYERDLQKKRVHTLKSLLEKYRIPYYANDTHIISVKVGDSFVCKQVSDVLLKDYKILIQPINYPTVPRNTERLRLTPGPRHTDTQIRALADALAEVWQRFSLIHAEKVKKESLLPDYYSGSSSSSSSSSSVEALVSSQRCLLSLRSEKETPPSPSLNSLTE